MHHADPLVDNESSKKDNAAKWPNQFDYKYQTKVKWYSCIRFSWIYANTNKNMLDALFTVHPVITMLKEEILRNKKIKIIATSIIMLNVYLSFN